MNKTIEELNQEIAAVEESLDYFEGKATYYRDADQPYELRETYAICRELHAKWKELQRQRRDLGGEW